MLILSTITYLSVLPEFSKNRKTGLGLIGLGILTFAMAMFPIQCGDFFYYNMGLRSKYGIDHFEDFYIDLWKWQPNYILWRAIVWGCTTVLLLLSIKRLKVNVYFSSFIFVITQFFYWGTMRNMFGFMLMFYSLILILTSKKHEPKKFFIVAIGGLGLFLCQFLHKSMFLYLLLLIPALIPFGKKFISASLIAYPFLYGIIFTMATFFLANAGIDDGVKDTAELYTEDDSHGTFMQGVNNLIKFFSYAYLLYVILKNTSINTPYVYKFLTRYAYILIYLGALFWGQKTGGWLFLRFTDAGFLSLMFVMMHFYYHYPRTKGVKLAFGCLIYIIAYNILYILYFPNGFIDKAATLKF